MKLMKTPREERTGSAVQEISKNLSEKGYTIKEICEATGFKFTTVYCKMIKNNIKINKNERKKR